MTEFSHRSSAARPSASDARHGRAVSRGLLTTCILLVGLAFSAPAGAQDQPAPTPPATTEPLEDAAQPAAPAETAPGAGGTTTGPRIGSGSSLPGGASSLNETHGDWTVACAVRESEKRCALSQAQGDRESGSTVFAVELTTGDDGSIEGVMLAPFGLALDRGLTLSIDDKPLALPAGGESEMPLAFSTCIPTGCLVPVAFEVPAIDRLKRGNRLQARATAAGSSEAVQVNVSLTGFAAALNRVTELSR